MCLEFVQFIREEKVPPCDPVKLFNHMHVQSQRARILTTCICVFNMKHVLLGC